MLFALEFDNKGGRPENVPLPDPARNLKFDAISYFVALFTRTWLYEGM